MSNLPRQMRTTTSNSTPTSDDAEYRALLKRASLEIQRPQKLVLAQVDASVDTLNHLQAEGDLSREKIGEHLFRNLLGNDTALAFAPVHELPATFLLVKRRVGASLDLEGTEFNLSVRVGALNQLVPEDGWQKLRWSKKKVLAGLVNQADDLKALRQHEEGERRERGGACAEGVVQDDLRPARRALPTRRTPGRRWRPGDGSCGRRRRCPLGSRAPCWSVAWPKPRRRSAPRSWPRTGSSPPTPPSS